MKSRRTSRGRDRAAERHTRWSAIGTLAAGIAGALGLLVSAVVAYQGILAWRDQTDQARSAQASEERRQAAQIGIWVDHPSSESPITYVVVNRSLDPVSSARISILETASGVPRSARVALRYLDVEIGTIPPCTRLEFGAYPLRQEFKERFGLAALPETYPKTVTFADANGLWWRARFGGTTERFEQDWPGQADSYTLLGLDRDDGIAEVVDTARQSVQFLAPDAVRRLPVDSCGDPAG